MNIGYTKDDLCCVMSQDEVKSEEVIQGAVETRFGQTKQAECGSLQPRHKSIPCMTHAKLAVNEEVLS